MNEIKQKREFMKSDFSEVMETSDQKQGKPQPPLAKTGTGVKTIELPTDFDTALQQTNYYSLLQNRRSRRAFAAKPVSLAALSFLLWSTQGVQKVIGKTNSATLRPVPSGGCRHAFETYVSAHNVEGLEPGIYHYLSLEHKLEWHRPLPAAGQMGEALAWQAWAENAPLVLFWSAVPYRSEWRYGKEAQRLMLMDAGHVGQNAYLSAGALGLGTCCCAAYNQQACDALLGLDGEEEFVVYFAPFGHPKQAEK